MTDESIAIEPRSHFSRTLPYSPDLIRLLIAVWIGASYLLFFGKAIASSCCSCTNGCRLSWPFCCRKATWSVVPAYRSLRWLVTDRTAAASSGYTCTVAAALPTPEQPLLSSWIWVG